MTKLISIRESSALLWSLESFGNWRGATMPDDPKCQTDIDQLINPIDGKSAWEGEPPLWEDIVKKRDQILRENRELIETKKSAYRKLGMTEEEINVMFNYSTT
tara:strand:+ start:942 stop:1250 length:309 start_codon:yes stop_codon:yes gene_type:complete